MTYRDECLAKYGELYRLFRPGKYGAEYFTCFYCGDPADAIDHQPPITRVSDYRAFWLETELYITVPCCMECNTVLSDALTIDLLEREVILKNRLAKKYKKAIKGREWTNKEIYDAGITGSLRRYVRGRKKLKDRIEARLDYDGGVKAFLHYLREQDIPLSVLNGEAA